MSNHHAAELRGSAGPARIAGFTLGGLSLVLLVLRPELPQLWLPPLCSLAIGAWVYRLAGQRSREVAARLYGALQLAAWVLVIALFFGLLSELGWSPWSRNDTADRGQGLVLALIMLAYANVMPKMPASRAWQAQLRFAGWALVLGSVGYALAWLLARRRFPGRVLLDALVHLPLVVPPVVTGYVLLLLFGRTGPVGQWLEASLGVALVFRWTGAALAAAVMALPLMVRAMRLSIEAVDRRLVGAARTLGASRWQAFRTITLPLSIPGVMAGTVLGFARSIGEFGATITFVSNIPGETRTLPLAIYSALQVPGTDIAVARLAVLAVLLSLGALLLSEWLVRRSLGKDSHVL